MLQADDILFKTITDSSCIYVFPTEIAASAWADRALEITDAGSVAMNRFIAWDTFKSDAIRSQKQNKRSIPSVLRTLFAEQIIAENARLAAEGKTPLFTSLIHPQYAQTAQSFSKWIASLLPSLGSWYEHITKRPVPEDGFAGELIIELPPHADSEDYDLLTLTIRYSGFLAQQQLFEPAWEKPPFKTDGHTYYIFYPEILADFFEYEQLLESAGSVTLVHIPEKEQNPPQEVQYFSNSRAELAAVVRRIRTLNQQGVPWNGISVNITDIETYAPYLERELELHEIPYVRRAGKPLSDYGAGRFFRTAQDCVQQHFPFDSVRQLLLDKNLPWKDSESIDQLIAFGKKNNCLCSWQEDGKSVDIWEQAFASAPALREERARTFYTLLKKELTALSAADSFERVRLHYFSFREKFFDMERCAPLSDQVLGRCIAELMALIDIENTYPAAKAARPFAFFVQHIADKEYLPRTAAQGVNLLPYRAAAGAASGCHIVIGASQKTLSVTVKQLGFLREEKRRQLKLADADLSASFIQLYGAHSTAEPAYFTFAENSFDGYAIPHSALVQTHGDTSSDVNAANNADDAYKEETAWFSEPEIKQFPLRLYPVQKTGFLKWSRDVTAAAAAPVTDSAGSIYTVDSSLIRQHIRQRMYKPGAPPEADAGLFRVSVTDMHAFYDCPVKWLYSRIFEIESFSLDTELTASNTAGLIYHAVLERFFTYIKNDAQTASVLPPLEQDQLPERYADFIRQQLGAVLGLTEQTGHIEGTSVSVISAELLRACEANMCETLCTCLRAFLSYFAGYEVSEVEKEYSFVQTEDTGLVYLLKGRIDLILIEPETDAPVIIDFKTGKTPLPAECVSVRLQQANSVKTYELKNFQTAMYTLLYEQAHPGIAVEKVCFFSITQAKPAVIIGSVTDCSGKKSPYRDSLIVSREAFEPTLQILREKIVFYVQNAGSERELSAEDVAYKTCGECLYRHICRTQYSVSGNAQEDIRI